MAKCKEKDKIKKRENLRKLRTRKKCRNIKTKIYLCLQKELRHSNTHTVPYLVDDRINYMERLFWLVSLMCCIVFAVILLTTQYWRYVTAPTVVSVEMNYFDWNISYPAITICPLYRPDINYIHVVVNSLKTTKISKCVTLKTEEFCSVLLDPECTLTPNLIFCETFEKTGLNFESYLWAVSQSAMDTLEYFDLKVPKELLPLIQPTEYALVAAKMFRLLGNSLHANRRSPISVDAAMTEMGMCHIINSNVAIFDKPEHWNDSLLYEKKNIDLSIYDKDFFVELNNYAKIYKVFIHSPDEAPIRTTPSFMFDFEGIMSFGLSVWSTRISEELRHQSLRIRKCRFTTEPRGNRYPVYSYNHCILECRIKMIKKLCGCVPHFYKPLSHERVCYVQELLCVLQYRREIVTLAATEQTRKQFQYSKDIPTHSRDCKCINSCEFDQYYKDREEYEPIRGVNKLSINITSFPKVRIVRDIIFSAYDILLRSGGVINLCIGSSILSLVEFIVVIVKTAISVIIEISRVVAHFNR